MPKKTSQAKTMSAGLGRTAGGGATPLGVKGPASNQSQGSKKTGPGAAGGTGKSSGKLSAKAKRPGGK